MTKTAGHPVSRAVPWGSGHGRAFTLVELLVVISIFVILLALAVPSFSSLIYSSSQASAVNAVRRSVAAARSLARGSASGRDTAAVFTYRPGTGVEVFVYIEAGSVPDLDSGDQPVTRTVFVPASGYAAVALPGGWLANGYTLANTIDEQGGSSSGASGDTSGWYEDGNYEPGSANWVFPETDFYNKTVGDDGARRQTFMVRFQGGTGDVTGTGPEGALLLMPSEDLSFRGQAPWNNPAFRVDQAQRHDRFVSGVKSAYATNLPQLRRLVGDEASDSVLAKSVSQVVVYNSRRMAGAIGARRLNRETGCLYEADTMPKIELSAFPSASKASDVTALANSWFEHRLVSGGNTIDSDAIILAIDRTTGEANEVLFY